MKNVEGLEKAIGYVFSDKQLLITALTHPTYANEHRVESYQRLEYLGDAILDFIVAEDLFERYPGADEGVLTTKRIAAVSATPLMKKARELGGKAEFNGSEEEGFEIRIVLPFPDHKEETT